MVIYKYDDLSPMPLEVGTDGGEVQSDTGELYRSWEKGYGTIDTPKTKCAYGFLGKNEPVTLSGVTVSCKTDFAVIALSALCGEDIKNASQMLLTTVGRAENTDSKFDGDLMLNIGRPPVQIEVIEAEIEIETAVEGLRVWAISPEGYYIGNVPQSYADGKLRFTLGKESQSMYYVIIKE